MLRYLTRRVLALIPTLIGVSIAVVVLVRLVPGTLVEQMLGVDAAHDEAAKRALTAFFGLDRPLHVQYLDWAARAVRGDLGRSWRSGEGVLAAVLKRWSVTAELGVLALTLAVTLGVPLGILSAVRRQGLADGVLRLLSLLGLSVPVFWQGSMLILLLSLYFRWLPPIVFTSFGENPWVNLKIMALPALCLATASTAVIVRMTRSCFLEVLRQDYVRTARAKGLAERSVLYRHALRNALIPIVTIVGLQLGAILGGSVVVEEVFALPGLGRLVVTSIFERDYPLTQGAVLFLAVVAMVLNLLADLLYGAIDPRIRYG